MFCIFLLPVFLLTYLIVGLLIKAEDGGPIFYSARRIGKDSCVYVMYKFRSMRVNAPLLMNVDGSTFNSKTDPRVMRIGRFIRETSIDEIPQVLNVLVGDMSIIGPRPSLESALTSFQEDEVDKMKVKPGITGLTQAYHRNALSPREKRLMDAWYANNVSFSLDMRIIMKTVIAVIRRDDIYTPQTKEGFISESKGGRLLDP